MMLHNSRNWQGYWPVHEMGRHTAHCTNRQYACQFCEMASLTNWA